MNGRPHFSDGSECRCDMKWSANPTAYVRAHPNKRGPDDRTFVDEIDATRRSRL